MTWLDSARGCWVTARPRGRPSRPRAAGGDSDRSAMLRAAVAAVRQGAEPASEPAPNAPSAIESPTATSVRPTRPASPRRSRASWPPPPAGCRWPSARRWRCASSCGLSYDEIAAATGVAADAVPLAAGPGAAGSARAAARRRGAAAGCDERERALRTIARRQDGEEVSAADDDWLIEHLGHCRGCRQAHAAMLEASACYRAWAPPDTPGDPVAAAAAGS